LIPAQFSSMVASFRALFITRTEAKKSVILRGTTSRWTINPTLYAYKTAEARRWTARCAIATRAGFGQGWLVNRPEQKLKKRVSYFLREGHA
jgi:hypothetical protein